MAAALFAFVPIALAQLELDHATVWVWSSLLLALYSVWFLIARLATGARIARQSGMSNLWSGLLFAVVYGGVIVLQIANIANWPLARGGAPYLVGVYGVLVVSAASFILLALGQAPERRGPAA